MEALDYNRSFAINTAACDGEEKNTCRTQLLARCEIETADTGQTEAFFLGKECIGEYMYREGASPRCRALRSARSSAARNPRC